MYLLSIVKKYIKKLITTYYTIKAKQTCNSIGIGSKINHRCNFTTNTIIGNNCHFNGMTVNGNGKLIIGDNFHSGSECLIITQNHNYDNGTQIPYDDTYILKDVTIGKNVWFGSRVLILPGATIEDGCIIQAGSVVHGLCPRCSICGGNPAKIIKYRDIAHYNKLEEEKRYH